MLVGDDNTAVISQSSFQLSKNTIASLFASVTTGPDHTEQNPLCFLLLETELKDGSVSPEIFYTVKATAISQISLSSYAIAR